MIKPDPLDVNIDIDYAVGSEMLSVMQIDFVLERVDVLVCFSVNLAPTALLQGDTVVKVLYYKSEGRRFDPSWCHWNIY